MAQQLLVVARADLLGPVVALDALDVAAQLGVTTRGLELRALLVEQTQQFLIDVVDVDADQLAAAGFSALAIERRGLRFGKDAVARRCHRCTDTANPRSRISCPNCLGDLPEPVGLLSAARNAISCCRNWPPWKRLLQLRN